jgi:hypothetical protein
MILGIKKQTDGYSKKQRVFPACIFYERPVGVKK